MKRVLRRGASAVGPGQWRPTHVVIGCWHRKMPRDTIEKEATELVKIGGDVLHVRRKCSGKPFAMLKCDTIAKIPIEGPQVAECARIAKLYSDSSARCRKPHLGRTRSRGRRSGKGNERHVQVA